MKTLARNTLLAVTFGGLLAAAGGALAHGWHDCDHGHANFRERMQHFEHRRAERLAHLKEALKITPAQQSAWQAFADASTKHPPFPPHWGKGQAGKPGTQAKPISTPERLDRHIQFAEQRLAHLKSISAAMHKLYNTLSPEQRQTMDKFFSRHRHHDHD